MLFLDLDDFKAVNDAFGHVAGDQLLIAVANRRRQCVRDTDASARVGGDEFVLVLEDMSLPLDGSRRAGCVKTAQAAGDHTMRIHASLGLAISPPARTRRAPHEADTAMYRAKEGDQALDRRGPSEVEDDLPKRTLTPTTQATAHPRMRAGAV